MHPAALTVLLASSFLLAQAAPPAAGDGPCIRPGDINADGRVDGIDLGLLLGNWGGAGSTDINGDGTTDGNDLGVMLGNWG